MINNFEQNKKFYRKYIISKQSLFIWTIFLIYLKQKGLSFTEIMLLNSITATVTFILEIPSGILADRVSRKKLLFYGEGLKLLSLIIILYTNNYYILIISSVFSGIGEATVSGSGEALIYDSFVESNKQDSYKKYTSNAQMWALRFSAVSTLISGFLYKINKDIPMILSIVLQFISILFILRLNDNLMPIKITHNIKGEFKIQLNNIKSLINNKDIIKLFFIYFVMMIIISNLNYTSQSYLTYIGIDVKYIGIIFFLFNIIASFGAKYSAKINLKSKSIIAIFAILLIGLNFSGIYLSLVIFSISRFINGMIWPILNSDINKKLQTENRATMLSYKSLIIQISFIIFDPLVGLSIDLFGLRHTYALMGLTIFIILINILVVKKIVKLKNK